MAQTKHTARAAGKTGTALVIGCGVGGAAAAMALQRAGLSPSIYEAYPGPADHAGVFLNLASNGLDALRVLEADVAVYRSGFPTPEMVMWSGSGKRLGSVANGLTLPDGRVSITIARGELHRVLRQEAEARQIPVVFGKRLVEIDETAGRVVARFADGTEAAGDLLVGADGLHSMVRRYVAPGARGPRYTGLLSLGGVARGLPLRPTPGVFHMIFGRRAFFGYTVRPSGDTYWFANVVRREEPSRAELAMVTATQWRGELLRLCAGDAGPMTAILGGPQDGFGAYPIHDMPTVPTWHHGSVAIIGDAAHATSPSAGQGASLAIEDAVVLGRCVRDLSTPALAFAALGRLRRQRVERIVAYAARIGQTKIPGPIGRRVRDVLMPFALKHFAQPSSHPWVFDYHIDWDARVEAA
jgi:2-polyprenyl-6-methoxyphenol hydroxylase-like FAD-dependent oxidoreductase